MRRAATDFVRESRAVRSVTLAMAATGYRTASGTPSSVGQPDAKNKTVLSTAIGAKIPGPHRPGGTAMLTDPRHLHWDACLNVRDLGGFPTRGGGTTRRHALVRADNLCRLTAHGRSAMPRHGVRTAIAL